MTLPATHTAGDTLKFTENHADYLPTDGWAVSYVFVSALDKVTITSSDDGNGGHAFNVSASTTANWIADEYNWQRYFTNGAERYSDGQGKIEVFPNFEAATGALDARSDWQQILDALNAAYKKLTTTSATVVTASYKDRSTTYRTVDELLTAIRHAEQQVRKEDQQQKLRDGLPVGNKIFFRA